MRNKILYIILILAVISDDFDLYAQNSSVKNANYGLAECFSADKVKKMVFDIRVNPNWLEEGDKFWYKYKTPDGVFYYIVDPVEKSKKYLFDNHEMARMLTLITKDPYDYQHLPSINPKFKKNDTVFQFDITSTWDGELQRDSSKEVVKDAVRLDSNSKKNRQTAGNASSEKKKKLYHLEYNLETGKLYEVKDWKEEKLKPVWMNISPDSSYAVYAKDHNLFYMDKVNYLKAINNEKDSTIVEHQITTDGVENYSYARDYSTDVNADEKQIKEEREKHRNVYVIWSPDSKKIAITRKDNREIKSLWVINSLANPRPQLETYKYLMPGEKDPTESELLVVYLETKRIDTVNVKKYTNQEISIPYKKSDIDSKKNLPFIWLSGNPNVLYFERRSRDMRKYDFCMADLKTGNIKVFIEEKMNTYLDVQTPIVVNNGKEFIHLSERDGWAHYYLYDDKGNVKKQLTSGPWHCSKSQVDEKKCVLYFTANGREEGEDPYYSHFYKVNLDGTSLTLLNNGNYNHYYSVMSNSKKYFVDNYSRVDTVPRAMLKDTDGKLVLNLEITDLKSLFASGYKFPEPFVVKAADGVTDIYGVLYKPFDFDSTKKYPIIEYVYPGPITESVNKLFSGIDNNTDRLAQLGFIVISLGNRGGSPERSKWYHDYGYGDLRDYGLDDKKYAVEQLADKYKYIDIEKVGICGHSGGGFMAAAAICQYPDFFKVAISVSGNHDNTIYHHSWSEKHHGVREIINQKEDGSEFVFDIETNPQIVSNLKGKLLLVTGDIDNNVHPANTFRMVNALIKANKRFDMFIMAGEGHDLLNNEYCFWLYADYFCKNLLGDDSHAQSADIIELQREHKMSPSKKTKL